MAVGGVRTLAGWVARSVGSAVGEGEDLLRGIWGDDDPDGVELEPLPDMDEPELDALDDPANDVEPSVELENPDEANLTRLLSRLDPAPPLPLAEPFSAVSDRCSVDGSQPNPSASWPIVGRAGSSICWAVVSPSPYRTRASRSPD